MGTSWDEEGGAADDWDHSRLTVLRPDMAVLDMLGGEGQPSERREVIQMVGINATN